MSVATQTQVVKNLEEKSILVSREFNAPLEIVWRAYTEKELLDQWWGPQPWRAETKHMDFSVGGYWLYAMVGPENQKHWGRMDYLAITKHKSFKAKDCFCDEAGNLNPELPISTGSVVFSKTETGTRVEYKLLHASESDLLKTLEMGYAEGISLCIEQLVELLASKKIK